MLVLPIGLWHALVFASLWEERFTLFMYSHFCHIKVVATSNDFKPESMQNGVSGEHHTLSLLHSYKRRSNSTHKHINTTAAERCSKRKEENTELSCPLSTSIANTQKLHLSMGWSCPALVEGLAEVSSCLQIHNLITAAQMKAERE